MSAQRQIEHNEVPTSGTGKTSKPTIVLVHGAVAANYSEDPQTAFSGGDMGFLSVSQLRSDPLIFEAVSKLKAGESSPILPPGTKRQWATRSSGSSRAKPPGSAI